MCATIMCFDRCYGLSEKLFTVYRVFDTTRDQYFCVLRALCDVKKTESEAGSIEVLMQL